MVKTEVLGLLLKERVGLVQRGVKTKQFRCWVVFSRRSEITKENSFEIKSCRDAYLELDGGACFENILDKNRRNR